MMSSRRYVEDIQERVDKGLTKCFESRTEANEHARKTKSYVYELENHSLQEGKFAVPK